MIYPRAIRPTSLVGLLSLAIALVGVSANACLSSRVGLSIHNSLSRDWLVVITLQLKSSETLSLPFSLSLNVG